MVPSFHIITGGASTAALATGASLATAAAHDPILVIPAAASAMAALGGFLVAGVSYWRHRNDASELAAHEANDNARFDQIEALIVPVYTHLLGTPPPPLTPSEEKKS